MVYPRDWKPKTCVSKTDQRDSQNVRSGKILPTIQINLSSDDRPSGSSGRKNVGGCAGDIHVRVREIDNISLKSVSIQNLEFPMEPKGKPLAKVRPNISVVDVDSLTSCGQMYVRRESKGHSSIDRRVAHFTFPVSYRDKKVRKDDLSDFSLKDKKRKSDVKEEKVRSESRSCYPKKESLKKQQRVGLPCDGSIKAGAPKPYVGVCPPDFAEIAKLSKPKQKFYITEDPRKKYCLVNPDALRSKGLPEKEEFDALTGMVKYADNICDEEVSKSEENFLCEIIDQENPMQLDFQGLDYKNTYEKDEQDITNQHIYRKLLKDMERKRAKKESADNVEQKLRQQLLDIPKCFQVEERNAESVHSPPSSIHLCKLYRSNQKPENKAHLAKAKADREERYKSIYMAKKEKTEKLQKERKEDAKRRAENLGTSLAIEHFNEANVKVNEAIKRSFKKQTLLKRKEAVVRDFPHTIKETKKFKRTLKHQNRIKRDKARLKQEFYEQLGKEKHYPEADLEISDSSRNTNEDDLSTQSSDDEDEMEVGRVGDKIKLRGFHFKLGQQLRGKYHQNENRAARHRVRGCETREEWLRDLLPKKVTVRPDVYVGIEKKTSADDPNLVLFHAEPYEAPQMPEESAIRQYIKKRLGLHYQYDLRKNIKFAKPKLRYSVKKFNFIKYSFGREKTLEVTEEAPKDELKVITSTKEYIEFKQKEKEAARYVERKKRLDLLGIPCEEIKRSRLETLCENSESSDSDWVPARSEGGHDASHPRSEASQEDLENVFFQDNYFENGTDEGVNESAEVFEGPLNPSKVPMKMRGNMPAPKYREPTLRINTHRPRDYYHDRIPSALLDEIVPAQELPVLLKLKEPIINFENVREPKRPYTKMLETRHHHDHWDPTDHPLVNVHYMPKIVKPKVTEIKVTKRQKKQTRFESANPPWSALIDKDLTVPDYNIKDMVTELMAEKQKQKDRIVPAEVLEDRCKNYDYFYHSRNNEEEEMMEDYPGRQQYLNFLKEIRNSIMEAKDMQALEDEEGKERLAVDRDKVYEELEEDLKSIESCLTSISSSECTNLTNDSGSFLLLEGNTKLPLDYVRNALVPFEELQRSRFKFQLIDVEHEENNPFRTVPFAGQKKEQKALSTPADSFFTFTTRLRNGLRLRLEVPVEDVRQKPIGRPNNKYPGSVLIDIDENYVKMLEKPPPVTFCKFKTGAYYIKDALRMKFESMLIQGQIIRKKIYDQLNELHWQNMHRVKMLYEKLFAKWKKREYQAAMTVVYQVKLYYAKTDILRDELHNLERQFIQLNMDIVFLEAYWIRCIQYQNFHYLLADQEWRHKHDWIHRIYIGGEPTFDEDDLSSEEDDQRRIDMESYDVSIAKRPWVNIRQRDKDDAWAIKDYYYNIYLKNIHPILQVFEDHMAFIRGVESLKSKTFVLLLEMHFTLSIHTELEERLQTFQDWCTLDLKNKREYVDRKCAKKYFMERRAANIRKKTLDFMDKPIEESFNEPTILYNGAIILEVWRQVIPSHLRGSEKGKKSSEMVAMIVDYVLEILNRFELMNVELFKEVEENYRRQRVRMMKISQRAYQIEKRIEANMKKIMRNMLPVAKRPPRAFKPPRLVLKKKAPEPPPPPKPISEQTKYFLRAFHDDPDGAFLDARESLIVIDTMQEQIVPFYFDHFLKLNGYTPNYNFKTQIELRDGPEVNRLAVPYVIPEILQRLEQWEVHKKKTMEDNIAHNPQMYLNII